MSGDEITAAWRQMIIDVQTDPIYIWMGTRDAEDHANNG